VRIRRVPLLVVLSRVMFVKELVSDQVIFSKCLVVPVSMPAAVRSSLGLERRGFLAHRHAELHEHFLQNRIGLKLKEIVPEFHRCMPVSQMVRGTHQGVRRLGGNAKDVFCSRFDPNQCAVFRLQKVPVAQHGSAWQEESRFSSIRERRSKPALGPKIE